MLFVRVAQCVHSPAPIVTYLNLEGGPTANRQAEGSPVVGLWYNVSDCGGGYARRILWGCQYAMEERAGRGPGDRGRRGPTSSQALSAPPEVLARAATLLGNPAGDKGRLSVNVPTL